MALNRLTTRELFWIRALGSYRDEDAVRWAVGELEERPATPNLSALAGSTFPYNHFEIEDLLRRALAELGLHEPDSRESYRDFLCEMGQAIVTGQLSPREGCARLAEAHGGHLARRELQPFWLLEQGARDLEAGENSWHYPELTRSNFDDLVRREAGALIETICRS